MGNTPVEVQFIYLSRMSQLSVPHPTQRFANNDIEWSVLRDLTGGGHGT